MVVLVGERGREVREFLEDTIGPDAMAKTVAVVSTSDESAMMRKRAPDTAMRVAEHFRDLGHRVLLVLDSITRFAHALREVATGTGEPPVARGYPASVFTDLPKLLERAGPGAEGAGSITAIFSVLVDGDDHNDPVADSVRGILDGHVVLDRAIAEQGRYPPVNPLSSISRLAPKAWSDEQRALVTRLKSMISRFEDTRDIRLLGAYQAGADAELDIAVRQVPHDLRSDDPVAEGPAVSRPLRRPRPASESQGQAECLARWLTSFDETLAQSAAGESRRQACGGSQAAHGIFLPQARQAGAFHCPADAQPARSPQRLHGGRARLDARADLRALSLVHLLQSGGVRRARHQVPGQRRVHIERTDHADAAARALRRPSSVEEIPPIDLDLIATGTSSKPEDQEEEHGTPGLTEQPFPAPPVTFKLVHVANGRAMIEDDHGLFIVQRGSVLPDSSRVISIEERDGRGVLITSTDQTLEVVD